MSMHFVNSFFLFVSGLLIMLDFWIVSVANLNSLFHFSSIYCSNLFILIACKIFMAKRAEQQHKLQYKKYTDKMKQFTAERQKICLINFDVVFIHLFIGNGFSVWTFCSRVFPPHFLSHCNAMFHVVQPSSMFACFEYADIYKAIVNQYLNPHVLRNHLDMF